MKGRWLTIFVLVLLGMGALIWGEAGCKKSSLREEFSRAIRRDDSNKVEQMLANAPELLNAAVPHHFKLKDYGLTPLMIAAACGSRASVEILLRHGANTEARSANGATALWFGINKGDILELLLRHGAAPDGYSVYGETPLQHAVLYGKTDAARLLLSYGANPNRRNDSDEIPLLQAVDLDNLEIVKLLLASKADANIKSSNGYSALKLAKNPAMKEELIRHGARESPGSPSGKSAEAPPRW